MADHYPYNYTLGDSPPSDRLVISLDETSQQPTQTDNITSPVSPQTSSFSVDRLLGDAETTNQHAPRHDHHDIRMDQTHDAAMKQLLPNIHHAFDLYSTTSLADSLARIFDLGYPVQHSLPSSLPTSQMLLPVNHATDDNSTLVQQKKETEHKQTFRKKTDIPDESVGLLEKPPYTYVGMIIVAIDSSPDKMLTLSDIRATLQTWFPFFTGPYTGWKASVRHTVSSHNCFYKTQHTDGKYSMWAVRYENVRPSLLVRQNRSTFSADIISQYRYHLHEQVGVPAVLYPAQYEPTINIKQTTDKQSQPTTSGKPAGLKLPAKPSFEHRNDITADTANDFLSGRHDDVLSQTGDFTTETQQTSSLKRKADTLDTQDHDTKRKKTLAVNPTPSIERVSQTPAPETTKTNDIVNQEKQRETYELNPTIPTIHGVIDQPPHGNYPTQLNYQHELWPQSTSLPYPTHANYQHQQWPSYYDQEAYYQTAASAYYNNNYMYQQHINPTYQMWPYNTAFTQGQGYYNYNGYWNQMADPTNIPVNLSKNSHGYMQ